MEPTDNNLDQQESVEPKPAKQVTPESEKQKGLEKPVAPAPAEKAPTVPSQAPVNPPPVANAPVPPPAAQPSGQPPLTPQTPADNAADISDESGKVDKQYVDKAEEIIKTNADDPHKEEEDEEDLSQDFLKKKFNLDVNDPKGQ
ncbi:MAG: hypothetical protein Q8P54_03150 [bacterium]|nr:hypothetical protein [bacterium]